jgi:hypothetical protein
MDFQKSYINSSSIFILLTVVISYQLNLFSKLDLVSGIEASAASGNTSPVEVCTSGSYNGATDPYTASNTTISIPLNTNHNFNSSDFVSNICFT